MLLNDFKLLKEDSDSYHLSHPAGRKFIVTKSGLSEKAHAVIKKLPHFDEGGVVPDFVPGQSYADAALPGDPNASIDTAPAQVSTLPQKYQNQPSLGAVLGKLDSALSVPEASAAPIPAEPEVREPAAKPVLANPSGFSQPDIFSQNKNETEKIINQQEADLKNYVKSSDAMGAASGKAYGEYADKMAAMQSPQDIVNHYKAKDDALVDAFANTKIDPDRYWHNKDTGSKVLSGIGIILGGMGAHATGGRNLPMEQINESINRDIDAQKSDKDKTFTLWKMNRAALDSDMQADAATKNQLLSIAQAKAMKAQAAAPSAAAKLRANQLISDLEHQKMQNRFQMALMQQGSGGTPSQMDPAKMVTSLVPEAHQKDVFNEIKEAQNATTNEKPLMEAFDKANSENTVLGRTFRLGFTPPSIKAFNALTDPLIHQNEGRINELEQQHVQALAPAPGDSPNTIAEKKAALQSFINQKKAAPMAKGFGINLENFQSTAGMPEAPKIQTMNGAKYQKVAGGWKKVM